MPYDGTPEEEGGGGRQNPLWQRVLRSLMESCEEVFRTIDPEANAKLFGCFLMWVDGAPRDCLRFVLFADKQEDTHAFMDQLTKAHQIAGLFESEEACSVARAAIPYGTVFRAKVLGSDIIFTLSTAAEYEKIFVAGLLGGCYLLGVPLRVLAEHEPDNECLSIALPRLMNGGPH
jgi:hypothetical protein